MNPRTHPAYTTALREAHARLAAQRERVVTAINADIALTTNTARACIRELVLSGMAAELDAEAKALAALFEPSPGLLGELDATRITAIALRDEARHLAAALRQASALDYDARHAN